MKYTRLSGYKDFLQFGYIPSLFLSLFFLLVSNAQAVIPAPAVSDPLYAKGYLNVKWYGVSPTASAATNTLGINQAIIDAYNRENNTAISGGGTQKGSLSLYFPPGTYNVNNTLKAHTSTGTPASIGNAFDKPKNHLTMVGSTTGASRPKLKLIAGAVGFGNSGSPKYLLEFRNWKVDTLTGGIILNDEEPDEGYYQMLRGIDLDCGGNAGCTALYFNNAQNSSIEDVNIDITNAHTGIKGGAGPAGGIINVVIKNGRNGIDATGDSLQSGSATMVVAGVKLLNQTENSLIHGGFAPITMVGFEIVTPNGSTRAGLKTQLGFSQANFAAISLVDGIIRMGGQPTVAAIDNTNKKNFYARNVYITPSGTFTGTTKVLKSVDLETVAGPKQLINEYSYTMPPGPGIPTDETYRVSQNLINGTIGTAKVVSILPNAASPPTDLVSRHSWLRLPSVDDADAFDVRNGGINPGTAWNPTPVDAQALQDIIDAHQKVFMPKGVYQLKGTVTLRFNTILFGAGRGLTRIEVHPDFSNNVVSETPVITTDNVDNATTYLGDLSIGVDATDLVNDYFTALHWRAGASSMVHMGTVYRSPSNTTPINRYDTNPHNLIKITDNGGGRWYFPGSIKAFTSDDPLYRIIKVHKTTQPLWLYSLNIEHPRGPETYVELNNADNVRVYQIKSEYTGDPAYAILSSVMQIRNGSENVGLFGHAALRNGLENKGAIEFLYSNNVLATLIAPQRDGSNKPEDKLPPPNIPGAKTITEAFVGSNGSIDYPNVVSLFKRGTLNDSVMVHTAPSY